MYGRLERAFELHPSLYSIAYAKIVVKAVVLELDRKFETDRAQYGFKADIQITHAAFSVLAAIHSYIILVVLDLSKAYEKVVKELMRSKLRNVTEENLTNQLIIFLLMVKAQVTGVYQTQKFP